MRFSRLGVGWGLCAAALAAPGCDSAPSAVTSVEVASPSGEVQLSVSTDDQGRMTYTVTRGADTVIESSPLGLMSDTHDLTAGVKMTSSSVHSIDESYTTLVGKRRERDVVGNEITVPLTDAMGARAELVLRAHDDGAAFRYHLLGEGTARVTEERTGFAIPSGGR